MIENRNKLHAKKASVKRIRAHDFRHSFVSLNYALGVDPKTISTQMGHNNLTITLDTYVNLFDDKVKDRVNIINKVRNKFKWNKLFYPKILNLASYREGHADIKLDFNNQDSF